MVQTVLNYEKRERKFEKVLEWVLQGSGTWEAWQKIYHDNRTPGTGDWFVNSKEIKPWLEGKSQLLVCHGTGISFSYSKADHF